MEVDYRSGILWKDYLLFLGCLYEFMLELVFFFLLGCGRICFRMFILMNMIKLGLWRLSYLIWY